MWKLKEGKESESSKCIKLEVCTSCLYSTSFLFETSRTLLIECIEFWVYYSRHIVGIIFIN
jgi:hypothetical protein